MRGISTNVLRRSGTLVVLMAAAVLLIPLPASASTAPDTIGLHDPATGLWHLRSTTGAVTSFYYGDPGDQAFMGDWNCDGLDTPGVLRAAEARVFLRNSNSAGVADFDFFFGNPGDIVVPGDFDNDGCDTVALYRPLDGTFHVTNVLATGGAGLGAATASYAFGPLGGVPIAGDFNGDGTDTFGIHLPDTGLVQIRQSHTPGNADLTFYYGDPGDTLTVGDWNGDGTDTVGVYRPGTPPRFYLRNTNTPGVADITVDFTAVGMMPLAWKANTPPVASDQSVGTAEDVPLPITLTGSDANGDPLTFTVTAPPAHGTLAGTAPALTYTPQPNYNGPDSLTFAVSDGKVKDQGTVSITVTPVNDAPVADDDAIGAGENDGPADVTALLLAGDGDVDGDTLTVSAVDGTGTTGAVTLASGVVTYDPNGQFEALASDETATDSFTYQIGDGNGGFDTATATITITGVNDPPTAQDDAVTTDEDTTLGGDVKADNGSGADSDPDTSDVLGVTEVNGSAANVGVQITLTSDALLTVNSNGTFSYDPNGQFESLGVGDDTTDSFTYQIGDGNGGFDTATATITITGVNDPPTAQDDAVTTDEDTTLGGDVKADNGSGADSDPEGDPLTVTEVNGSAANVGVQITLTSDALLTVNSNGTFSYDPNGQFESLGVGDDTTDSFTYQIGDGNGGFDTATATITITGVNDPPTAQDDAVTTDEDTTLGGDVKADNGSGADSDPEGDPLTVTEVNGSAANVGVQITLTSDALLTVNSNGTFSYDPNGQFESLGVGDDTTDSFTYQIGDGNGGFDTATATITITGVNDPPTAQDDAVTTDEDTTLGGDVKADNGSGADSDPEGDPLTVTEVNGSAANVGVQITLTSDALLTVNSNGTFSYDPNGQFESLGVGDDTTDSFTYQIGDGNGGFDTATATITITGVNDDPTAQDRSYGTFGNTLLEVAGADLPGDVAAVTAPTSLLTGATDPDNAFGDLSVVAETKATTEGGSVTIFTDGSFTYVPDPGDTGLTDTFTFTVEDGEGGAGAGTASIVLTDVVWYVDDSAAPGGDGTSATPFQDLAPLDAGGGSDALDGADTIYLLDGSYSGGIALEADQQLFGQGVDLVVDTTTLITGSLPQRPDLTDPAGDAVTLATGNTIRGINVGDTAGFAFGGSGVGMFTINNVRVTGTGGIANITNGTAAVALDGAATTAGSTRGIDLDSVGGSFAVDSPVNPDTSIVGSTIAGIEISNAPASATFDFGDTVVSGAAGIDLSASGTSTFTFDTLAVTATAGSGLTADTAGTLNITAATTTIDATGGAALDITSTALDDGIGGGGVTLASLSSVNSAGRGINLDGITGDVTVTGDTTITNPATEGIRVNNTAPAVDVRFGDAAGNGTVSITKATPVANGVLLRDVAGSFTVTSDGGGILFTGANDVHNVLADNVANLTLEGTDPTGGGALFRLTGAATGALQSGLGPANSGFHALAFVNSGDLTLRYVEVHEHGGNDSGGADSGVFIVDPDAGATANIDDSTFNDVDEDAIEVEKTNAGGFTINIRDNAFSGDVVNGQGAAMVHLDDWTAGHIIALIADNTFDDLDDVAILVRPAGTAGTAGTANAVTISDNVITESDNNGIIIETNDTAVTDVVITGNTLTGDVGADGSVGDDEAIDICACGDGTTGTLNVTIGGSAPADRNTITNWDDDGIRVSSFGAMVAATINLTVQNNLIDDLITGGVGVDVALLIETDDASTINARVLDNVFGSDTTGFEWDPRTSTASTTRVFLSGNQAPLFHFDVQANSTYELGVTAPNTEIGNTLTTPNATLATLLDGEGNTAVGGGAATYTFDAGIGFVIVDQTTITGGP